MSDIEYIGNKGPFDNGGANDTYKITQIWESVSSKTGTITTYGSTAIVQDLWANGENNAIIVQISSGRPIDEPVLNSSNSFITASIDSSGNYTLSDTPSGAVGLVWQIIGQLGTADIIPESAILDEYDAAYSVEVENNTEFLYLKGNESTDGSIRFGTDAVSGDGIFEMRESGVWQPATLELGTGSLFLGPRVAVAAFGHHVATEDTYADHMHLHAHNVFDGEVTTLDARIVRATSYAEDVPIQPDYSGDFLGTLLEFTDTPAATVAFRRAKYKTGTTEATSIVRLQAWQGTDDTGPLLFDQRYPPEEFPASSDISLLANGWLQIEGGVENFIRFSSAADFSLKMNAAETSPYFAADMSVIQEDDMLEVDPWVSGATFTIGQWAIQGRKIYICNTAGVQTGTFASNSSLWDELSHVGNDFWSRAGTTLSPVNSGDNISVGGDVHVGGDVIVDGAITSSSTENLLVKDNHILLSDGYQAAVAKMGGVVVNYLPTSTADTVSSGAFVAGIAATSNPTAATVGAAVFSQDDIIMIYGSTENDGLYEVHSHAANLLTVRGIGTVGTVEGFTNTQFVANASDSCTITKINVSVLCSSTTGDWRQGKGSTTPITFTDIGDDLWEVSGTTLQNKSGVDSFTFNNGTIDVIDINGNTFIRSSLGNSKLSLYSDGGSAIQDATRARLNIHNSVTQLFSQTGASQLNLNGSLAEFLGTIFRFNDGTSNRIEFTGSTSYLRSPDGAKYFQLDDTTTGLIRNGRFAFRSVSDSTWLRDVGTNARITLEGGMTFTRDGSIDLIKADATDTRLVSPDGNKALIVNNTGASLPDGSTAVTQSADDNSTKVATTAYVDSAVSVEDLWDVTTGTLKNKTGPTKFVFNDATRDRIDIAADRSWIHDEIGSAYMMVMNGEFHASDGTRSRVQSDATDTRLVSPDGTEILSVDNDGANTAKLTLTNSLYQPVYGDNTGLVLNIPFTEVGTDEKQYDKSGQGKDASPDLGANPVVNATGGPYGGSVGVFDGSDDYYTCDRPITGTGDDFTYEVYFNPSVSSINGFIINHGATDHDTYLRYYNGKVEFHITFSDESTTTLESDTLPISNWYHAVGTYDGTTVKLYIDGWLVDSEAISKTTDFDTGFYAFELGGTNFVSTYFNGDIADIKVYNRAIHEDEIRVFYLREGLAVVKTDNFKIVGIDNNVHLEVTDDIFYYHDGTRARVEIDSNKSKHTSPGGGVTLQINDAGIYTSGNIEAQSVNAARFYDCYDFFIQDATRQRIKADDDETELVGPDGTHYITVDDDSARYNDNKIATISSVETEVYSLSDLPAAVAGVITLTAGTYIFKASMSFGTDRIELTAGAAVSFRTDDPFNHTITYTGTGTFITGLGQNIFRIVTWGGLVTLLTGVNPTYLSLQGSFGAEYGAIIFTDSGGGNLGTIQGEFINEVSSDRNYAYKFSFINWKTGFNISESNRVEMDKIRSTSSASATGSLINVSGKVDFGVFENMNVTLNSASASIFNIDPAIQIQSAVVIEKGIQVGDIGTYFKTGTNGTFTVVADASITAGLITAVSDNGSGVARFASTETVYQYQEIDIDHTHEDYDGIHIISNIGSGWFECYYVDFVIGETLGGFFDSNSVTLTDTGTSLSDGDTILIKTDESTDYDGGSYVYHQLTNTFQINIPEGKTWQATETGTWDTASLTEDNKHVEGKSNGQEEDSHSTLFAYVNTNATTTTFSLSNTWYPVELGTVVEGLSTSRFKYIGDNTFKITTLSPLMGAFEANLTAVKTGSDKEYEFRINVTSGIGSFDAVIKEHTISTGVSSFPVKASGFLQPGDEFQIEARVASTSQSEMTISGFNGEFR